MEKMTRGCVRCHKLFQYGDMNKVIAWTNDQKIL